jgi:hypothetical protein
MNPPAAIDALFNRIARREALPARAVVNFDTTLPPFQFQVEAPQEEQSIQEARLTLTWISNPTFAAIGNLVGLSLTTGLTDGQRSSRTRPFRHVA